MNPVFVIILSGLSGIALYAWVSAGFMGIFRKAGVGSWRAWVPVLNAWTFLRLGKQSGWWTIVYAVGLALAGLSILIGFVVWLFAGGKSLQTGIAFAVLIVVLVTVVVWVVQTFAVSAINARLELPGFFTVLGTVLFPVWLIVAGWGTSGWSGRDHLRESGSSTVVSRTHERLTGPGATIASLFIALLWTIPTVGLFITSIRPKEDTLRTGWWQIFVNPTVTLQNYTDVLFGRDGLAGPFVNSLAIAIPATVFPLVIASLAGYAFAWMQFKGRDVIFVLVFALQIVPIQMALVPLLSLFSRGLSVGNDVLYEGLRGAGQYSQVWIAHTIFALPLAIFLLHNFISEIPGDVIEAARVDGASHGQIFFRIVLPLSLPAIASFAIFQFLWVWNDLLVALIFATGEAAPITRKLAELTGEFGQNAQLLPAGAFISILVPLVVFLALQRFFVRGLLAGSTKG